MKRSLLLLAATLLVAAQAHAAATVDYILTAPQDPVKPGSIAEFDVTLRNISAASQFVRLHFTVPDFTTYNGNPPGTDISLTFGTIAIGRTVSGKILLAVPGGNQAPPNGTTVTLRLMDFDRGAAVSRSVVVRAASPLNLQVSSGQGTIAPGQNLSYTLVASNVGISALPAVQLSVPVPPGSSFVSADGGGVLTSGVVSWSLGSLPRGAIRRLHVNFQASSGSDIPLAPLEATLTDSSGNIARASDTRPVYAAPEVEYTITSPTDPIKAGSTAEFDIVLHNPSGAPQFVRLHFTVPDFTTYNGNPPGTDISLTFGTISVGQSVSGKILLAIPGGNEAPPAGATITLKLMDFDRGAAVSRTIAVSSPTPAKADFNRDGLPDWVLENPSTRQLAIWFMNDAARLGAGYSPTLPPGWTLIDADQFDGSTTSADLLLYNSTTRQSAVWYLSGTSFSHGAVGPTLPAGWSLVLSQDFNGDGKPDLLLYNQTSRQTAIWYLNGTAYSSAAFAPTLPAGWFVVGAADFDGDQNADFLLWNPSTRQTAIWYLNGSSFLSGALGPTTPAGWRPSVIDDVNRDGKPDVVLWNPGTHQTAVWHLNNNVFASGAFGPAVPAGWVLSAPK